MTNTASIDIASIHGRVLVVDDDKSIRLLHQALLKGQFEVDSAAGGEEALARCAEAAPDLVLLDVEMPGLNGYETCRRLRETSDIPILFATSHQSLEEHVKAYDAGGDDIITKPVAREILLRKVALAIHQHRLAARLAEEKNDLKRMAMSFLSSVGQSGILLNFMRASLGCRSHAALAAGLVQALGEMGVVGSVLIRHQDGPTAMTPHGPPTPLELAILQQAAEMDRIFQFSRRLVVNYPRVSILVADMPDPGNDAERAGQLRDNVAILAETLEALCETVDMRSTALGRAEQLHAALSDAVGAVEELRRHLADTLLQTESDLHQLVEQVEASFSWLGTNQAQEQAISGVMQQHRERILNRLADNAAMDQQFNRLLTALRGGEAADPELF